MSSIVPRSYPKSETPKILDRRPWFRLEGGDGARRDRDGRRTQLTFEARCPFCARTLTIFVWSFAGSGCKKCPCGAILRRALGEFIAEKLITLEAAGGKTS